MLTPADIDSKRFSTTRLKEGYDQDDVDDFLDEVQEAYKVSVTTAARLEEENRVLRRKLELRSEAVTSELVSMPDPPSIVAQKLIEAAETAAQEHEAEAKAKADEIVRKAGGEGARIVEEATEAAERVKAEGLAEKYRRNEELDRKATALNEQILDLNDRGHRVKQALTEALNAVNGVTS